MKVCAVLFDRDGTLIENVPYNGDPKTVRPLPDAREALDRLRQARIPLAVVSNQSGIGRGLITHAQMEAVNRRMDELLGPFDAWLHCPHLPDDNCECRKPKPKLIADAARALGVDVACCVVVGDAESDVQAAHNAGAQSLKLGPKLSLLDAVKKILKG